MNDDVMPAGSALKQVLLVHVRCTDWQDEAAADELTSLAETAGAEVRETVTCQRQIPDPATFVGAGKAEEIRELAAQAECTTIIFNQALTPGQERNLEKITGVRVMDRVALILLIFAQRARSYEGRLQVELAQLRFEQARLVRGWTHLERQKGGFGLRGGPGETQIELDRRQIGERIAALRTALEDVDRRRSLQRGHRQKMAVPLISLVGYTNAGKSTLFNRLCSENVYAADQLFATLDPTLRSLAIPGVGRAVLADTVGFIRHLPHELVAAFRSTLEETVEADLLLHVADASSSVLNEQTDAVEEVLEQIGAGDVPRLQVLNKADLLENAPAGIVRDGDGKPLRVFISAGNGDGIADLLQAVAELLSADSCRFVAKIRSTQGRLRGMLYAAGAVRRECSDAEGRSWLELCLSRADAARIDRMSGGELAGACLTDPPWQDSRSKGGGMLRMSRLPI